MRKLITLIIVIFIITFPKLSFAEEYTVIVDFDNAAFDRYDERYRITKLYIVPTGGSSWENEILDGDVINLGETMNIKTNKSQAPYFDVKAIIVVDGYDDVECLRYTHYNLNAETEKVNFENNFEQVNCN